jgi:PKD repeat protein
MFSVAANGNTATFVSTIPPGYTANGYTWSFGDGGTANTANPVYTYANAGWYYVCMTVWGLTPNNTVFQCSMCDSVQIGNPIQPCNSNYSFTQSGFTANFTSLATGPGTITNYAWNFGDGNQSNLQNPSHTYANAGTYISCLTIYGVNNGITYTCSYCDTIVISNLGQPCNANFVSTQIGLNAAFSDQSTSPGPITNYVWNFGDGNTSNLQNPTHTYATSGVYNVCLTISGVDSNNNTFVCTYCDSINVQTVGTPCTSSYTYVAGAGNSVSFTSTSTAPGPISNYQWAFGDGGTANTANPTHTYANPGWYNVCLTISGQTAAGFFQCYTCDSIYVGNTPAPCNADFSYVYFSSNTLTFANTSTGNGTLSSSMWMFGDGNTSTQTNPTHTYTTPGWYNVCLVVSFVNNGMATTCTYCDSVFVQGGLNPNNCFATANFTGNIAGNTANFINTSTCVGCTSTWYAWDFGDATYSTLNSPSHTYSSSGNYNVCLIVNGTDSMQQICSDTFCYTITVGTLNLNTVETNTIKVYPNPTSQTLEVTIPHAGTYDLKIIDITGQLIRKQTVQTSDLSLKLDVSQLVRGMYFIQINNADHSYRNSFIKQ